MIDLRNVTQVAKMPIEMSKAGEAINKAIDMGLKVRVRVDNKEGFYLDTSMVVTCCFLDENSRQITIKGAEFNLEFEYETFEFNSMSGADHTKFYFRQKESTLGITVMY